MLQPIFILVLAFDWSSFSELASGFVHRDPVQVIQAARPCLGRALGCAYLAIATRTGFQEIQVLFDGHVYFWLEEGQKATLQCGL